MAQKRGLAADQLAVVCQQMVLDGAEMETGEDVYPDSHRCIEGHCRRAIPAAYRRDEGHVGPQQSTLIQYLLAGDTSVDFGVLH